MIDCRIIGPCDLFGHKNFLLFLFFFFFFCFTRLFCFVSFFLFSQFFFCSKVLFVLKVFRLKYMGSTLQGEEVGGGGG